MSAIAASLLHPPCAAAAAGRQPSGQRCFAAATSSSRKCHRRPVPRCQHQQAEAVAAAPSGAGRRQLLQAATLLGLSPALGLALPAAADEATAGGSSSRQAYFDITVDRKPLGRIVIEVPTSAPAIGGQRFLDLAQGKEGMAFRKTRFELIEDAFIQDAGLQSLSYQASGRTAIAGGPDTELLEEELAAQAAAAAGGPAHSAPGLVSLLVKPRIEIVNKDKLVASKGKLITVTETFGEIPNGSAWAITTKPIPELDETHLVVGRVVQGMDVVQAIAALPRVKDNTNSPFFQAGKLAGDKRADVAQRAFNKPYAKITVNECGLL
ncbi:hypothetical protein ABPG75_004676 [Micractinium tetrahymenae]